MRRDGRGTAMLCAVGWSIPYGIVMLISASMTADTARNHYINRPNRWGYDPPPPYMTYLLISGALVWLVCTVAEVLLARSLGSEYPPLGPLAGMRGSALPRVARRAVRGLDRRLGSGGCMALITVMVAGPLFVLTWSTVTAHAVGLWLLILVAAVAAHLVKVVRTLRRRRGGRPVERVGA